MTPLGAYGFRIEGDVDRSMLRPAAPAAPLLTVSQRLAPGEPVPEPSADVLVWDLDGAGHLRLDLSAGTAEFLFRDRLVGADQLVHPYLALAAGQAARLLGRHVLHGGALSWGDRAVLLVGHREAGKSSLVAWASLHSPGCVVVGDDLCVLHQGGVFAGPRSVDLRPDGARELLRHGDAVVVRGGDRQRLDPGAAPGWLPLAGVVVLEWSQRADASLTPLPPAARLGALLPHTTVPESPAERGPLLELAALPVSVLRRPRRWDVMADAVALLHRAAQR